VTGAYAFGKRLAQDNIVEHSAHGRPVEAATLDPKTNDPSGKKVLDHSFETVISRWMARRRFGICAKNRPDHSAQAVHF